MLLTVNGPRTVRELAELVKALMDSCPDGGPDDLDAVLAAVGERYLIAVSDVQREQVFGALAAVLPAEAGWAEPTERVATWVTARLPRDPGVLRTLLTAAWTELCAQAEAVATREHAEHEEREHASRDPVADDIRQLTLPGRYYVVAHNGRGKPLLSAPVIGLGLAAGAVAELVIAGRLDLRTRTHQVLRTAADGGEPAPSGAARRVLRETPTQPVPLRDHLTNLSTRVEEWVVGELLESGIVSPETHGMLRGRVYYAPSRRGLAKAVRTLVGGALRAHPIPLADAVLAELAIATGLDAKQSGGWDRLASLTRGDALAGTDRPEVAAHLKLLVDLTAAEVDSIVTSPGI